MNFETLNIISELNQQISNLRALLWVALDQRDEARREVCKWECRFRPMSERDYAASRKWDCFPPRKMFEDLNP